MDVWLHDFSSNNLSRLTFQGASQFAIWTPDGKRVAFLSNRMGVPSVFWKPADGSGNEEQLTRSEYGTSPDSWSPDGHFFLFHELHPGSGSDMWIQPFPQGAGNSGSTSEKPYPFLQTPANEQEAHLSPDGHWVAYISDESGRFEVYVRPFPGSGGKRQVSTGGGSEPRWSPSGKELFFRAGDKMMAADVVTQPGFSAGTPRLLFQGQFVAPSTPLGTSDFSPDGQRILMMQAQSAESQAAPATQINVVQNWFEELKRRAPAGK